MVHDIWDQEDLDEEHEKTMEHAIYLGPGGFGPGAREDHGARHLGPVGFGRGAREDHGARHLGPGGFGPGA